MEEDREDSHEISYIFFPKIMENVAKLLSAAIVIGNLMANYDTVKFGLVPVVYA